MASASPPGSSGPASRWPEAPVARLATVSPSGRPHLVPICFAVGEDGRLYSAVDEKPKSTRALRRLDNIRANPWVEVLVDRYDEDWSRLWWVRISGRARVVERDARALELLRAKYPQYRQRPPAGPFVVVEVERVLAWQASGRS
ncbi:MAG TPA: TIGR03668 family PPOX class F420-dependent oxidoreductase [Gaiellaceae bacterium]|nr:TIGR03668 family PPOX class F420-dependent oxidoreductase [Gaiellaceae bacterium]